MLDKAKIDQFFDDIKYVLSDNIPNENIDSNLEGKPKLTKEVADKEGDQRTNVIYLNTDCNLRCEYCYEGDSRTGLPDQVHLTTEGIDEFLQEIAIREKNSVSTIVIMGGEPFLRFDLVQYIIARSIQIPKNKGWGISLVTNGTLFTSKRLEKFKELLNLCKNSNSKTNLSLEISYDGSGHHRRKWPDGSSSLPIVEKCLDSLCEHSIPFKVSYVVHKDNMNNVIEDAIKIFERWSKVERLLIGFAFEELDNVSGEKMAGQNLRDKLRPYFKELYNIYKKPVCGVICGICTICNKTPFVGNSYLSPTTGISYDAKETEHKFRQF